MGRLYEYNVVLSNSKSVGRISEILFYIINQPYMQTHTKYKNKPQKHKHTLNTKTNSKNTNTKYKNMNAMIFVYFL